MSDISMEPRAARLTKNGRAVTCKGRLAFVQLNEPKLKPGAKPGAKPKYGAAILLPKGSDIKALRDLVESKAKEAFGDKLKNPKFKEKLKLPIKKCSDCTDKDGNIYSGFDDPRFEYCIWPQTTTKPGIVDARGEAVTEPSEVYSGRWGRLNVHAFKFDVDGNYGISFGLDNVQLLDPDEMMGGRARASDEFDPVEGVATGTEDSDSVFN